MIIDRHNRIHLAHHAYPGAPLNPAANYIILGYSEDAGVTWRNAFGTTGLARVSPSGENHSLCKAAYDREHDIVWYFWKKRDGSAEDIMAQPVYRGGATLGELENITGFAGTAAAAFHNFSVGADGKVRAHYHRSETTPLNPFDRPTIFYRERALPPPLTPGVTPSAESDGALRIQWSSEWGVRYVVETSTNLTAWATLPGEITGTLGELSTSIPAALERPQFFVRLRISR